jgi:hypothetical protein
MAKLTKTTIAERDRLVQQILDAVRGLYEQRLIRSCDLTIEQDEYGRGGTESISPTDSTFFAAHSGRDYRLQVVLAVRAQDR